MLIGAYEQQKRPEDRFCAIINRAPIRTQIGYHGHGAVTGHAMRRGFNRSISFANKIEEGTDIHFVGLILAITEI